MVTTRSGTGKAKALVTGGSGFVGQHLVNQLLESGQYDVTIFDIRDNGKNKAPVVTGDLRDPQQVSAVIQGMDVVFHVATAAPTGENALNNDLMYAVNVTGTENVIKACLAHGVPRLVFTSSSSVVFQGKHLKFVTEDTPYASKPFDYYTKTKIMAEQLILEANGKGGLSTVALRPASIFGEGDAVAVPTIARQAEKGKMKYTIGNPNTLADWTYVGNVAQAHIQAAEALLDERKSKVAGRPFFVTNQQPKASWGMIGDICVGLGYPRPYIHLPFLLVIIIAIIFEWIIRPLVKPFKQLNSDFTVNRILLVSTQRTFSNEAAKAAFGYVPKVPMEEALQRTLKAFEHLKKAPAAAKTD